MTSKCLEWGVRLSSNDLLWLAACLAVVYGVSYALSRNKRLAEKLGLSLDGPIIAIRTRSLASRIESCGRSHAHVLRLLGDFGTVLGVLVGILGFVFMHYNLSQLLTRSPAASPVVPLIPGLTISYEALPFFAFAVLVTLFPHELMHALIAAAEGVPVKSAGAFLAVLFPGGFAELDEDELAKRPLRSQARVFAAGSFANVLTFLLVLVAAQLLVQPLGVKVVGTIPGSPASGLLQTGDVIVGVAGVPVHTVEDFTAALSSHKPGDLVRLSIERGGELIEVAVTLASRPDEPARPMLGVYIQQALTNEQLYGFLWWTAVVSGSVALLNMLPLYPLDGGRLLALFTGSIASLRKRSRAVTTLISVYSGLLVVLNIVLSLAPGFGP